MRRFSHLRSTRTTSVCAYRLHCQSRCVEIRSCCSISADRHIDSCRPSPSINSCLQWLAMECTVSRGDCRPDCQCTNVSTKAVMHTDLDVSLDKMTVSPDLSDRTASPKDLLRRSSSLEGKRRNRQVRVQLSVHGTPRLTPNKVSRKIAPIPGLGTQLID